MATFWAAANRNTRLTVRVEQAGNLKNKIAQQIYSLTAAQQQFSFRTDVIAQPGRYRLAFYVGDNPAGDKIWLDAITFTPVN